MKEVFVSALFAISVLTSLTVEALKKFMDEYKISYKANILASIVSVILSVVVTFVYTYWYGTFNADTIMICLALCFFSWLGSMTSFDKVKQTIEQITRGGK